MIRIDIIFAISCVGSLRLTLVIILPETDPLVAVQFDYTFLQFAPCIFPFSSLLWNNQNDEIEEIYYA